MTAGGMYLRIAGARARATPDAHALVAASTRFSPDTFKTKATLGLGEFTPITLIGRLPYTLMMNTSTGARFP